MDTWYLIWILRDKMHEILKIDGQNTLKIINDKNVQGQIKILPFSYSITIKFTN